jgi:histidinol-phosphate aminotransferase
VRLNAAVQPHKQNMPSAPNAITPQSLLRQEVLALRAYHAPSGGGMVKLDAMENPYSLPQPLCEEIARLVADAPINRYPDAGAVSLKEKIRAVTNLPQGMDVLLGNGSDEIIQILRLGVRPYILQGKK